ncbi:MAG: hypothetical protein AAFY71_17080 [Bacteroidota bacterium]
MRYLSILCLSLFLTSSLWAQSSDETRLKLSLQTDLLAYTTAGGWSTWASAELNRYKLSVAFVNYPNRFPDIYEETGIQENPSWLRIQLSRGFKPTSKLKNFFYGLNVEHHWRELTEDNNPEEILNDTHWELGIFAGYEWRPWQKKENALQHISVIFWAGLNALPTNSEMSRVFENTGSIYDIPGIFRNTIGINLSYTIFQQ